MRWLEVRRHSVTKKGSARGPSSLLSQEGVDLARLVGRSLGTFASVTTSASPRAIETALAMGYAVDDTVDLPSGYLPGRIDHHDQWHWPEPHRKYAELLAQLPELAAVADAHRALWIRLLAAVPEGAAVLVVCHGGGIEPALVMLPAACRPRLVGPAVRPLRRRMPMLRPRQFRRHRVPPGPGHVGLTR
jgi:broad specificity phosphatase PhoE